MRKTEAESGLLKQKEKLFMRIHYRAAEGNLSCWNIKHLPHFLSAAQTKCCSERTSTAEVMGVRQAGREHDGMAVSSSCFPGTPREDRCLWGSAASGRQWGGKITAQEASTQQNPTRSACTALCKTATIQASSRTADFTKRWHPGWGSSQCTIWKWFPACV